MGEGKHHETKSGEEGWGRMKAIHENEVTVTLPRDEAAIYWN